MKWSLLVSLVISTSVHAFSVDKTYEINTHGQLTVSAAIRSYLVSNLLYNSLGLPVSDFINDVSDRKNGDKTIVSFPNSQGTPSTIYELLIFGSRFEDTVFPTPSNPEIGSVRSLHHFYDPQNNGRGLSPANHIADAFARFLDLDNPPDYAVGYPSLSWAIFEKDSLYQIGPSISYRQRFSYENAKEYFFQALTNRDRSERKRNFGLLFQTLGQVVHHIQDMAQPQHVRNDAHLPIDDDFFESHVSDYLSEELLETLIAGGEFNGITYPGSVYNSREVVLPRAVDYGDFEFLHSDRGADRVGMAEYTSTNFAASDIGFVGNETAVLPHPEYPLPVAYSISETYLESGVEAVNCGLQTLTYDGENPVTGRMKWVSSVVELSLIHI